MIKTGWNKYRFQPVFYMSCNTLKDVYLNEEIVETGEFLRIWNQIVRTLENRP